MATAITSTIVTTMTATTTTMIMATGMGIDTDTVTTAIPTVTGIFAAGTALTTITCLRVWPSAITFPPDSSANWS